MTALVQKLLSTFLKIRLVRRRSSCSDGSADFAGFVECRSTTAEAGIYIKSDLTGTNAKALRAVNGAGAETVTIYNNGSANFTTGVEVGTTGADATKPGGYVYSTRFVSDSQQGTAAINATDNNGNLQALYVVDRSVGSGVETVSISPAGYGKAKQWKADGGSNAAVIFAGESSGTATFSVSGDGTTWIGGNISGSNPNIALNEVDRLISGTSRLQTSPSRCQTAGT